MKFKSKRGINYKYGEFKNKGNIHSKRATYKGNKFDWLDEIPRLAKANKQ